MQQTAVILVPLVIILQILELASAKPIEHAENPELHDVVKTPVPGFSHPGIDLTSSDHADFNTPDFIDTVAPDDKKIIGDVNSDKSVPSTSQPVPVKIENVAVEPGSKKPGRLPTSLKPVSPARPGSLVTNLKPDSWTVSSTITSLESASDKDEDANSLVTSLEHGSVGPDNLVTALESGRLSTTLNIGTGKPGSLPTTLESDSGRRGNSPTTLMPDSHHLGNKFTNLPVASESKNGASGFGSSCMMVLLGIVLIAGSQSVI